MYHFENQTRPTMNKQPTEQEAEVAPAVSGAQALLNRLTERAREKGQLSVADELFTLNKSDPDSFEDKLDEVATDLAMEDEEFIGNIATLKASSSEMPELRKRQREIYDSIKGNIISTLGLDNESTKLEAARVEISRKIADLTEDGDGVHDILTKLGIIKEDETGKERFEYPEGLYPESVDKKWQIYLESVRRDIIAGDELLDEKISQGERERYDAARRMAHNAVTRDVHRVMGFDEIDNWKFEDTRNFLAKMRDHRFPTIETGEKYRTEEGIRKAAAAILALTAKVK